MTKRLILKQVLHGQRTTRRSFRYMGPVRPPCPVHLVSAPKTGCCCCCGSEGSGSGRLGTPCSPASQRLQNCKDAHLRAKRSQTCCLQGTIRALVNLHDSAPAADPRCHKGPFLLPDCLQYFPTHDGNGTTLKRRQQSRSTMAWTERKGQPFATPCAQICPY